MEGPHEDRAASVYDSCNADHDPHIMFPKACRYKWQRQSRTDAVEHPVHCKFSQLKPQLFADRGIKDTGTVVDESQSRPLQDTAARKDEPGVVQSVFLLFHCYFCLSPAFSFPHIAGIRLSAPKTSGHISTRFHLRHSLLWQAPGLCGHAE